MFRKQEGKSKAKTMERNILAKNTRLTGDVTSDGDFRIDGTLEGTLKTSGRVIIGPEGMIKGTVECSNADIEGKFSGKLVSSKTLSLKSSAVILGEVITGKLSVEPGATFNATCSMKGSVKELNTNEKSARPEEKTA
jgi:cytoskeletal protein CcmA (bactofilin family)